MQCGCYYNYAAIVFSSLGCVQPLGMLKSLRWFSSTDTLRKEMSVFGIFATNFRWLPWKTF